MKEERLKKLESIIKRVISNSILERLTNLEEVFWIITITSLKISTDLSYIDVFVSCIKWDKSLTKSLAWEAYKIQKDMMKKISIRKIPKIRFRYDEGWQISWKIIKTINNLDIK